MRVGFRVLAPLFGLVAVACSGETTGNGATSDVAGDAAGSGGAGQSGFLQDAEIATDSNVVTPHDDTGGGDAMAGATSLRYCRAGGVAHNTFYVDGTKGHDDAAGSADAPWATVEHAIKSIKAGDTVVVSAGLYRIAAPFQFGPPGTGHDAITTFCAATGARVLFTSPTGEPPNEVQLHDYVRLEGLWFGGTRVPDKEQGCDITAIDVG